MDYLGVQWMNIGDFSGVGGTSYYIDGVEFVYVLFIGIYCSANIILQ